MTRLVTLEPEHGFQALVKEEIVHGIGSANNSAAYRHADLGRARTAVIWPKRMISEQLALGQARLLDRRSTTQRLPPLAQQDEEKKGTMHQA
jgi:hypothetical protein